MKFETIVYPSNGMGSIAYLFFIRMLWVKFASEFLYWTTHKTMVLEEVCVSATHK